MIVLQIHRVVLHTPPLFSVDDASMQYKNENNDEYILFKLFDGPDFDSPEYNGYPNRLWIASSFQALLLVLTNDIKIFRLNLSVSVSTSYFYPDNDLTNHLIETVYPVEESVFINETDIPSRCWYVDFSIFCCNLRSRSQKICYF